jgi:aminoglycoside 6'-N-acetyltransferase
MPMPMPILRSATAADLPLLRHWCEQSHVLACGVRNDEWQWEQELGRARDGREQLIAELDGRPIGFVQIIDPAREESRHWGDVPAGLRAVDIWLGDAADLGKGHGKRIMAIALARCFADPSVTAVLVDPLARNLRAHRFYQRLGFRFVERRRFDDDDCFVLRLDRDDAPGGRVTPSEIVQRPPDAIATLVLAHGAGAGKSHPHMQALADALERQGIGTVRFDFPFIEAGRKRVDPPEVATARIAHAVEVAARRSQVPVWLGGHSFGGRMASHAVLERGLSPHGLVFCSFPLHPAGKPSTARAAHLKAIRQPMLFVSGTRDALATRELLEAVVAGLPSAELHWLDTADHGFRILKRSRTGAEDVYDEAARVIREFIAAHRC